MSARSDELIAGMLRRGVSAQRIARNLGEPLPYVLRVLDELRKGAELTARACTSPDECGRARGRGHPPRGWIRVHVAGVQADPWYCGWRCLQQAATARINATAISAGAR